MMTQPLKASLLKLRLPGVDPVTIPVLTAEQTDRVPVILLNFLHDNGDVDDLGDLEIITVKDNRHNFTILSIAEWVTNGSLESGELMVEQLELIDLEAAHRPTVYDRSTHEQDITFVATAETHANFLQRLGLWEFSIGADMPDLQAYIRETICSHYPVYEAELIVLLTTMFKQTEDPHHLDPTLASFVSARMLCLRELLVPHRAILPLLRKFIGAKDRFQSLVDRAKPDVIAQAMAELCKGVGEEGETEALLDRFIEQNGIDAGKSQSVEPAPLSTPTTRPNRKRGRLSNAETGTKAAKTSATVAAGAAVSKRSATTTSDFWAGPSPSPEPDVTRDDNETSGEVLSTNDALKEFMNGVVEPALVPIIPISGRKARRSHPGESMSYEREGTRGPPSLRPSRPRVNDEYWSATHYDWQKFSEREKRAYTHAGFICETEAGTVASKPCSACRAAGNHVCEVYTSDVRNDFGRGSCAKCRIEGRARKCSLSRGGRTSTGITDE
jgi:hypothetical protein